MNEQGWLLKQIKVGLLEGQREMQRMSKRHMLFMTKIESKQTNHLGAAQKRLSTRRQRKIGASLLRRYMNFNSTQILIKFKL